MSVCFSKILCYTDTNLRKKDQETGDYVSELTLHTYSDNDITIIQNSFIDQYLPKANGEYVKLYLYLLRLASAQKGISVSQIADIFDHTEKDVLRAFKYWEKEGLLTLFRDDKNEVTGISFVSVAVKSEPEVVKAPSVSPVKEAAATAEVPKKKALTADRLTELQGQEEIQQLLFIAASYLGKTLSPTEISNILYFYDTLHFSTDLVEYLIEYCVSKGSKSSRYMEKVALEWAKEGITTVNDAKNSTNLYNKNYYTILNAFGIKGRGPAKPEADFMDQWINAFHFTLDIIVEACNRTIAQTQRPNFQYANKILEEWHKNNVHHLSDIQTLDEQHLNKKKSAAAKTKPAAPGNNKFNNFEQREYDFNELEQQLLNS